MPHTTSRSTRHLSRVAAALALALTAVLGACSGDDGAPVTVPTPSSPVLQPGRPGEPNATLTGSAAAPTETAAVIATDVRFYQDMIVHHSQALVMVDAALSDLADPEVKGIASRIGDEQAPEVGAMAGWLEERGQSVPPAATNPNLTDHGAHSMPGMATEEEISRLASASGSEADRLFLTLMIRHHEGALAMVEDHAAHPADPRVEEMAADISVTQTKQISQMQEMLERLT